MTRAVLDLFLAGTIRWRPCAWCGAWLFPYPGETMRKYRARLYHADGICHERGLQRTMVDNQRARR